MGAPPARSVIPCYSQPSESDVVHGHVRLREHQIRAIACVVVGIGARHVQHSGATKRGETVGCASGSRQLSPARVSTEMISHGGSYADRVVLVERVGQKLLPTAQAWRLRWPGPSVAAPGTERVIPTCSATSFQLRSSSRSSKIFCVEAG